MKMKTTHHIQVGDYIRPYTGNITYVIIEIKEGKIIMKPITKEQAK